MLIRFNVTNFLSFKEETEFNMLAGSPRLKPHHVYHDKGIDFVRAAALYGANGAGKSNLVKAISFLQSLVLGKEKTTQSNKYFKLDDAYKEQPSVFEVEFINQEVFFAYGVSILKEEIIEEWLYEIVEGGENKLLFERKKESVKKTKLTLAKEFLKDDKTKLLIELYEEKLLKSDELFLAKVIEDDIDFEYLKWAYDWFEDCLTIVYPDTKMGLIIGTFLGHHTSEFTAETIQKLDTGVQSITLEKFSTIEDFLGEEDQEYLEIIEKRLLEEKYVLLARDEYFLAVRDEKENTVFVNKLVSKHRNNKNELVPFEISEESDGTRRLLDIVPIVGFALTQKIVYIIDELDRSIHPTLSKELLKLFMDAPEAKGQLIFSTHESQLLDLDIFRQDEIWFAEKNKVGATTLYPLSDFNVRTDLVLNKGYLNGRFGAIPFLGDLKNWKTGEAS